MMEGRHKFTATEASFVMILIKVQKEKQIVLKIPFY